MMKKITVFLLFILGFNVNAVSIKGLRKKDVLQALYAIAKPQGLGWLHYKKDHKLNTEEIKEVKNNRWYIDYLNGRCMKIDLSKKIVSTRLFNQDNGENAAENAINALKKKLKN